MTRYEEVEKKVRKLFSEKLSLSCNLEEIEKSENLQDYGMDSISAIKIVVEIEEEPTYYDTLTAEEINMIEVTVQHEVGKLSPQYKRLIAELIYNRLLSEHYPNDVKEMLFQKNQFTGINRWYYPSFPDSFLLKRSIWKLLM